MNAADATPTQAQGELREAVDRLMRGVRDPVQADRACADMDRSREETFRRFGLLDIGVPAIRELRGELPDR
jgi:hypothetical protein